MLYEHLGVVLAMISNQRQDLIPVQSSEVEVPEFTQ